MLNLIGTESPIIQAPMAGVQDHRLAAAVSNAGGLGSLPCAMLGPEAPEFPLATSAIAPLRAKAEASGSGDFSPLWCGQNASGCRERSAAEILIGLAP
jgi:hypothetical protein